MVDNLSQAIAEAYASAPSDVVILDTLELRHASFDTAARIVRDYGIYQSTSTDSDGLAFDIYGHMLTLEADAPVNPSETVLFQACMFDFKFMEQRDGQLPELMISVDNVLHLLGNSLDEAALSGQAIAVTYREYLASDSSEPQFVLDGLTLQRVTAKLFRIEGSAGFFDIVNTSFTNRMYDLNQFPGLIGST